MKKIILSLSLVVALVGSVFGINSALSQNNTSDLASPSVNTEKVISVDVSHSYAYDTSDVNKLFDNADLVITGTINSTGEAKKTTMLPVACTPSEVKVNSIIKGTEELTNVNILVEGGTITLQEYENSIKELYPETLEKEQIDTYSAEEKKTTFVTYNSDCYEKLEENQNYILFLNKIEGTNEYMVISANGMIPINANTVVNNLQDISTISNSSNEVK